MMPKTISQEPVLSRTAPLQEAGQRSQSRGVSKQHFRVVELKRAGCCPDVCMYVHVHMYIDIHIHFLFIYGERERERAPDPRSPTYKPEKKSSLRRRLEIPSSGFPWARPRGVLLNSSTTPGQIAIIPNPELRPVLAYSRQQLEL